MNDKEEKRTIMLLNILVSLVLICVVLSVATFIKVIELVG